MIIIIPEQEYHLIKSFEDHVKQGWSKTEASEALGWGPKLKGAPKYSVMKVKKNISMQYFLKTNLV